MRVLINGLLGVGYLAGLALVWVGIELMAFERHSFGAGCLGVALGIGWWALLVAIGKCSRRVQTQAERKSHTYVAAG